MSFIKYLHPLWKSMLGKVNDSHTAVVTSIDDAFTQAEKDAMELIKDANLETATGEWLDEYGNIFGVFRKDNERDEDYRRRIVNWILTERGTVGSIKDAIEKWLDDPEAEVEIYEPFKNVFFLNKSKLNGPDHILGRYYTSAVIDVRFTKHVPIEIIEEIRKFKAAGVTAKLTRLPNRNNKNYTIQELKILKDRNFAVGSDISVEAWRPAGTGTIPTYAEKTSQIKPRNAFNARATTNIRSSLLPYDSTTSSRFTYNNTGGPDFSKTSTITVNPDAYKHLNKKSVRVAVNLIKNVTAVTPDTVPSSKRYYVGVVLAITYTDGTQAYVNVKDDTTPIGVIPPVSNRDYSSTTLTKEFQTDTNKDVKSIYFYTVARGFTGDVTLGGVSLDVFNETPTSIESPKIENTPPNPISEPLGGVPQDGKIGGINVLDNTNSIKLSLNGTSNQRFTVGNFKFGNSSGVEGNMITLYYDYEFIPRVPNTEVNGKISIQGGKPFPILSRRDVTSSSLKGTEITTPVFQDQPVRVSAMEVRCDSLDGTLVISNFKMSIGDYGKGNTYLVYPAESLENYVESDNKSVISTSTRTIGSPAQVLQFDLFKVFEDRFGSNFFANKPTVNDKIEYVRSMMRTVRLDIKVKSSLVTSSSDDNSRIAYYSVVRWDSNINAWDTNRSLRISNNVEEMQNIVTVDVEDLSSFICADGYVYVAITGSTNIKGETTLTRLEVDAFIPKLEFKRGTTIFTHTKNTVFPEPVIANWTPLPTDEYDKFSSTDNNKYVRLDADKDSDPKTPPQFLIAYYIPDVIAESIGEGVYRGVDDQEGRIQIAKNLVTDIGISIKARGLFSKKNYDSRGFETARYNNKTKKWVKMKQMDNTTNTGFEEDSQLFTITESTRDEFISSDGYMYFIVRGAIYQEGALECYVDLNYSELRLSLTLPDPNTIPSGSVRNLLLWTKDWGESYGSGEPDKGVNVWENVQSKSTGNTYNGGVVYETSVNYGSMKYKAWTLENRDVIKVGDKVVLSVDLRAPQLSSTKTLAVYGYWDNAGGTGRIAGNVSNQWQRFRAEFTVTQAALADGSYFRFASKELNGVTTLEFANYMLIKKPDGNLNPPYEQAPEEYLFAPFSGNPWTTYTVSDDLRNFLGYPITISVDVEVINGININLKGNRNRVGTELTYVPDGGKRIYLGSWETTSGVSSMKKRISTTYTLTKSNYGTIGAGIYIQSFGDYLRVSKPSIYLGDNVDIPWSPAPEDRGEDTNLYDIQQFIGSLVKNKSRTYFTLVDNDIIGYKRLEKIIPVIEVNPAAPKNLPKLKFAGKEWYMVPIDKVREEGAEHIYFSANIKGGMLENIGYSGVYLRENIRLTDTNATYQDTHTVDEVIPTSGVTRIAEYLESANYNRIIRSNANKNVPYGQDETFTLANIDRGSRLNEVKYTQKENYAELTCQGTVEPFIQFGPYNGSNVDIVAGDKVRLSANMSTPNNAIAALKIFFKVNGSWRPQQQNITLTKDLKRYEFVQTVPQGCTDIMTRIGFKAGADIVGKVINFNNVMFHNKDADIPYIEGNNLQQRIDELDIIHESMIRIVHAQ